ncbi:hypothetical protein [Rubrivivax gelatinosus]|jgi:hypothetical protein|uniref:hypothetical protein n=1 Tax=Rubrivivax gelatinosus TaxID=28068 RepID=UPI0002D79CE6|nr:hypothetical protein [Rubrivivax gelatinosus]MBG6078692.1 hypothetical protein [Rubrivivax gelatinosus]
MATQTISIVPVLDSAALAAARAARALGSRISGAGVFWISGGSSFWDAWTDPDAFTLRLGRLEVIVDLSA